MMNIDRMLDRLEQSPNNPKELARLSRFLGDNLPRQPMESLRALRAGLARCAPESEFARGYLRGLRDLLAAFDSRVTADREEEEALQLAKEGDWPFVLIAIHEGTYARRLSERLGKGMVYIFRQLANMRDAGLIEGGVHEYSRDELRLTLRGMRATALIKSSRLDDAGDLKAESCDGAKDGRPLGR